MLSFLRIKNFILIKNTDIEFCSGLNVFTGETGVGKTVLINAVKTLMGDTRDIKKLLRNEAAEIEGIFTLPSGNSEKEAVLRVSVSGGKERYYYDDVLLTQKRFREMTGELIDIHSQSENQSLLEEKHQAALYDKYCVKPGITAEYAAALSCYRELEEDLAAISAAKELISKEYDLLKFQYDEIKKIDPAPGEDERLKEKIGMLSRAQEFKQIIFSLKELITESDNSLLAALEELTKNNRALSTAVKELSGFENKITEFKEELLDYYRELEKRDSEISEAESLDDLNARLYAIEKLNKYGATLDDILAFKETLGRKLASFEISDDELKEKKKELNRAREELYGTALKIRKARADGAKGFAAMIEKELKKLSMPSRFKVVLLPEEIPSADKAEFNERGFDSVSFYIDTTKKGFFPLNMIASGGEISRIMLVLKEILASDDSVNTLIFDEIDAGVGGETALYVGEKLKKISEKKQTIVITHLHQIAKFADRHFRVERTEKSKDTITDIKLLSDDERIIEISRMLGGKSISERTVQIAKDMLGLK